METKILKVVAQTQVTTVQTKNGEMAKKTVKLKELGNDYADEYLCPLMGDTANTELAVGQLVLVNLRFSTHENNGSWYQDIRVNEMVTFN